MDADGNSVADLSETSPFRQIGRIQSPLPGASATIRQVTVMARLERGAQSPRTVARLGAAGCVVMACASYWVGAVPLYFRDGHTPVVSMMPISSLAPRISFYIGLAAVLLAWLQLGRLTVRRVEGTHWRALRRIALTWSAPLIVAIPLGSRDLWAYAAQSQLVLHHLDPYTFGPSALPGAFSVEVSHRWIDTPAPYGPLWLLLGRITAAIVGNHVAITVAVLRMLAVLGLLLLAVWVPVLAKRVIGRADLAVWLILANPLTLVLGVAGGHNDLLMVGLMVTGLAVVTGQGNVWRTLVLGSAVLAAATAVKSPAAVAVLFAVPLWLTWAPAGRAWRAGRGARSATAVVAFVSIGVFSMITAISGLGLGWVKQVNSSAPVVSWMSLPSLAAIVWDVLQGDIRTAIKLDAPMREFRSAGTVLSVLSLSALWLWAMHPALPRFLRRFSSRRPQRADVWWLLAVALFAVVVLGPSVQPWYFCWALVIAGLVVTDTVSLALIAGCCAGLVSMIRPNGTGLQMNPIVVPIMGGALLLAWAALVRQKREATTDAA